MEVTLGLMFGLRSETAIDYAKFRSRSHCNMIRLYDEASNEIEMHKHAG
jgi:hypothetical protein